MEKSGTDFSMKNIEVKYQIPSLQEIHSFLSGHPDVRYEWKKEQTDIYFRIPTGRLKLRLQEGSGHELIFYQRPDRDEPRGSEYFIYSNTDMIKLKQLLEKALGILIMVHKTRTLFLFQNVRIHLDSVRDAGSFVEFESVISDSVNEEIAKKNLNAILKLLSGFRLTAVSGSYADLLRK